MRLTKGEGSKHVPVRLLEARNASLSLAAQASSFADNLNSLVTQAGLTGRSALDFAGHHDAPAIDLFVAAFDLTLKLHDNLGWIETLGAAIRAVHDTVATVELHGVVHPCKALLCVLIPGVSNPSVC